MYSIHISTLARTRLLWEHINHHAISFDQHTMFPGIHLLSHTRLIQPGFVTIPHCTNNLARGFQFWKVLFTTQHSLHNFLPVGFFKLLETSPLTLTPSAPTSTSIEPMPGMFNSTSTSSEDSVAVSSSWVITSGRSLEGVCVSLGGSVFPPVVGLSGVIT